MQDVFSQELDPAGPVQAFGFTDGLTDAAGRQWVLSRCPPLGVPCRTGG
jgi:hypothetical protein